MDLRKQEAPHGHLASTSEPGARYKFFISSISHMYPGRRRVLCMVIQGYKKLKDSSLELETG